MNDNEILEGIKSLMKERDQAIAERTPHDYGFLKTHIEHLREELHKANLESRRLAGELERVKGSGNLNAELSKLVADMNRANAAQVNPEPSRLEIAAMLLGAQPPPQAGSFKGQAEHALRRADALIEVACAGGALIAAADAGGGPGTGAPEYGRYVDGKWVGTPIPQTGQSSGGSGGCSPQ
jgi:hypothetical protein